MSKIATARCPACGAIHSIRIPQDFSPTTFNGVIGVLCSKCNTGKAVVARKQSFLEAEKRLTGDTEGIVFLGIEELKPIGKGVK